MRRNYILFMMLILCCISIQAQDYCSATTKLQKDVVQSVALSESNQTMWYVYEASEEQAIQIKALSMDVDMIAHVFDGACSNVSLETKNSQTGSDWSSQIVQLNLKAGYSVYLGVKLYEGVTPLLTCDVVLSQLAPGEMCASAIALADKQDCIIEAGDPVYYIYTPAVSGLATVTNTNWDNLSVKYMPDCNVPSYSAIECMDPFEVEAGIPVILVAQNWGTSSETFNIQCIESTPGQTCASAIPAVLGENDLKGIKGIYWYAYTPDKNCIATITAQSKTFTAEKGWVDVFASCGDVSMAPVTSFEKGASFRMDAGITYKICWTIDSNLAESSMKFTIDEKMIQPGDFCDMAIPVTIGTDFSLSKEMKLNWYSFTPSKTGWIEIPINWNNALSPYFVPACSSLSQKEYLTEKDGKYTYLVEDGIGYLLCIPNQGTAEDVVITWSISDLKQGDDCSNPLIQPIDKQIPLDVKSIIWHHIDLVDDGDYTIIGHLGSFKGEMIIQKGGCESTEILAELDYGTQLHSYSFAGKAGDKVLIMTSTGDASDNWLHVRLKKQGDSCNNPIDITKEGIVNFEATPLSEKWYSFTTTADTLEINTSISGKGTTVRAALYPDCAGQSLYGKTTLVKDEDGKYLGYVYSWGKDKIKKATTYLIKMSGVTDPFNFEVKSAVVNGVEATSSLDNIEILYDDYSNQYLVRLNDSQMAATLDLYSISGKLILRQIQNDRIGYVNVCDLNKGVYLLKVTICDRVKVARIVIK